MVQDIHVKVEKKQETINQNQEKERDNQKQVANAYSKVLAEIKNLNIKNSTAGENLSPMDYELSKFYGKCVTDPGCHYNFEDLNGAGIQELILFRYVNGAKDPDAPVKENYSDIALIYTLQPGKPHCVYKQEDQDITVRRGTNEFVFMSQNIANTLSICSFSINTKAEGIYDYTGCYTSICEPAAGTCSYYVENFKDGKLQSFKDITATDFEAYKNKIFGIHKSQSEKNISMQGYQLISFSERN